MFELKIPSGSNPNRTHTVRMGGDGAWICSCPGWRFQRVPGNARSCRHIRQVASSLNGHLAQAR